jgi:predicted exporter
VTLLGIGVDYGVHLVHRYQERGEAAAATAELTPVILVAAAITILGYGTLVMSSYPPLRSIGLVSVVSVVALAAASVLVLPALLLARPVQSCRRQPTAAAASRAAARWRMACRRTCLVLPREARVARGTAATRMRYENETAGARLRAPSPSVGFPSESS